MDRQLTDFSVFEEMVATPDGARIYTYGIRPPEGMKCPIVIQRTPYVPEERANLEAFARDRAEAFSRGYAYLVQHCR
jgi:predicted acyl esterase